MGLISRVSSRTYRYDDNKFNSCRFIEEMPEDTIFHGIYDVKISQPGTQNFVDTPSGFGMYVDVTNEEGKSVLSRSYGSEGKFTFTTDMPGEFTICMGSNATSSFNMLKDTRQRLRVNFKIKVGEHTLNYMDIAKKDQLTEAEIHVRKMIEQVGSIAREQNFQRFREQRFRKQSEEVNSRVMKWAVAQVVVLILLGLYQMKHLRKFFEAKKLV